MPLPAFLTPAIIAKLKLAGWVAAVLFIFGLGFKANGYIWSAKVERLEAAHAKAIADQRARLLDRQTRINEETEQRERDLLRELEIQREDYALLKTAIDEARLVVPRAGSCENESDAVRAAGVDWDRFGRLFDSTAITRPAAEAGTAGSGDAASEGATDSR